MEEQSKSGRKDKINLQQKTFVYEYLKDFNAVRSYKAAGYSSKFAQHNAYKLLKNKHVAELVKKELSYRWDFNKDQWLKGLMELKNSASKHSDKLRAMELYGKAKGFLSENTTSIKITNLGIDKLNSITQKRLQKTEKTDTNRLQGQLETD